MSYLKSAPSNSSNCKLWCKNENSSVWNHNALFRYFGLKFWKGCCRIWNQYLQICPTAMFSTKIKFLEFGDQKCLIWGVLVWNLKILLSWLKSVLLNSSNCIISCKNKNTLIWIKKWFTWIFLGWNLKMILSRLKSVPSILRNCTILWKNKNA